MKAVLGILAATVGLLLVSCGPAIYADPPRYDHVVIVIEENKSAMQVVAGSYLALLRAGGAFMARSYGVAHPSQPNYIALFSGSLNGVTDNNLHDITAPNLAASLISAGLSFTTYSEGLPAAGAVAWESGRYVRTTPARASPGCRRAP